jgi:nucleoside-diphosphate-sugar epimerase
MTILVVGGSGFIGSHLCRTLAEHGDRVVSYDVSARPSTALLDAPSDVGGRVKFIAGSASDVPTFFRAIKDEKIEGIIYVAAVLLEADDMPTEALKVNVEGLANACEAARLFDLRRVVYFSSQGVYGARDDMNPVPEDSVLSPTAGMYQMTKYLAERLGQQYERQYGVGFVAIRPSMVFGPGQRLYYPLNMILAHAAMGATLRRPDGGDHPIDYTYVKDCAEGAALAYRAERTSHHAYNISSGRLITNAQVADFVQKLYPKFRAEIGGGLIGSPALWKRILTGPLNLQVARADLGYEPRYGVEGGLADYDSHLRVQPEELKRMTNSLVRAGADWI